MLILSLDYLQGIIKLLITVNPDKSAEIEQLEASYLKKLTQYQQEERQLLNRRLIPRHSQAIIYYNVSATTVDLLKRLKTYASSEKLQLGLGDLLTQAQATADNYLQQSGGQGNGVA